MIGLSTDALFLASLEAAVQIEMRVLQSQGGATEYHLQRVRECNDFRTEGDTLLFKAPGYTAKNFARLCECLAILSYVPGGVRFANLHFEAL